MHRTDYTSTLRLPTTEFPMRALAAKPRGSLTGAEARQSDLAMLSSALGDGPAAEETYRNLRNCLRWLLGCLSHPRGAVLDARVQPALERYMSFVLETAVRRSGDSRARGKGGAAAGVVADFVKQDLLAFYFDVRKDALYCDPLSSAKRQACLAFMAETFEALLDMAGWMAPNLAAEAAGHRQGRPPRRGNGDAPSPVPGWREVRQVRAAVGKCLEAGRQRKEFGSSLELALTLHVSDAALADALVSSLWDPAETLCVSRAVTERRELPEACWKSPDLDGLGVSYMPAPGQRCARSYRVTGDVGSDPLHPLLSGRDAAAVRELEGQFAG